MYSTCLPISKEEFNLREQERFFSFVKDGNCKLICKYLEKGIDINDKIEVRINNRILRNEF